MKRIRLVFIAVASAVLVLVGLLALRTLTSIRSENEAFHAAVADRAFEGMEEVLFELVREEEQRPIEHYRAVYVGSEQLGRGYQRSPLTALPSKPFILGYFQLDAKGRFESPHEGDPSSKQRVGELRGWADRLPEATALQDRAETRGLEQLVEGHAPVPAQQKESLRALKRQVREAPVKKTKTKRLNIAERSDNYWSSDLAESTARPEPGTDYREVAVEVTPFVGVLLDADHLALIRTVWADGAAYRQGMILLLPRVFDSLREQSPALSELESYLSVSFQKPIPIASDFAYRYRFGAPFQAIDGYLAINSLPDAPSANPVIALVAIALVITMLGLWSAYRMTAVVVQFAERRNNFVSAVTHELKTPLTSIRMYGEMLQEGIAETDRQRAEYYQVITLETERLSRLINNVLELSKLEKGQREPHLVSGSVEDVITDVTQALDHHARAQGFSLEVEATPDCPRAVFDRDALTQILMNLVDNALKYGARATDKRVIIRCASTGRSVSLSVRDFGPGVAPDKLEKVFEPFFRDTNELTRETKGSGIGLSLVKNLTEMMNAKVDVKNRMPTGFEVEIVLPAAA